MELPFQAGTSSEEVCVPHVPTGRKLEQNARLTCMTIIEPLNLCGLQTVYARHFICISEVDSK